MSISNTMAEKSVPINDLQVEDFQERLWNTPECLPTSKTIRRSSDAARVLSHKAPLRDSSTRSLGPSSNTNSAKAPQVHKASNFRSGNLSSGTSQDPSSQVAHSNDQLESSASNLNDFSCAPLSTQSDISANPELLSLLQFGQSDLPSAQPFVTSCSSGELKQHSTLGLSQADINSILQFAESDFHGSGAGVASSQAAAPLALPTGFNGIQIQNSFNDFNGSEAQIRENISSSYSQQPLTKRPLMSNQSTSVSSDTFDPGTAPKSVNVNVPETAKNLDDVMDMQTFMGDLMDPYLMELLQSGAFPGHELSSSITQPTSTSSDQRQDLTDPKYLLELFQRGSSPRHKSPSSISQPTSTSSEQRQHSLKSPPLSYAAPSQIYNPDKSLSEHQNAVRVNFGELGDPNVSLTKALDEGAFFSHCLPLNHDQQFTSNLLDLFNGSETQKLNANPPSIPQPLNSNVSLTSSNSASHADWDQLVTPDLINSAAQDSSHWIDDRAMWSTSPNTNDNVSSLDALNTFDQAYQGSLQHHGQSVDWGPLRS